MMLTFTSGRPARSAMLVNLLISHGLVLYLQNRRQVGGGGRQLSLQLPGQRLSWAAVGGNRCCSCYAIEATGAAEAHTTGSDKAQPIEGQDSSAERCDWSVSWSAQFHIFQLGMRRGEQYQSLAPGGDARCAANTAPASDSLSTYQMIHQNLSQPWLLIQVSFKNPPKLAFLLKSL